MDMYKLPIKKLGMDAHIFFSEGHFILFYNILTLDNVNNKPHNEENRSIDNKDSTNKEEVGIIVKVGNIIHLKYDNNNPVKMIFGGSKSLIKNNKDITFQSINAPIWNSLINKPIGYVFKFGKSIIEITGIENPEN